ncbi:MAG: HD domain-containing protein, partial [Candidatus Omnitrophica bacterium]|nr:HD domain-containing protein [Candidatus Omnitrophota bacterium]
YTVGKEISSELDIDEVLSVIVNKTLKILDSETISLLLIEDNTNDLVIKCAVGLDDDIIKETKIGLGEGISGWVAQNRKPILVKDITKSPLFARKSDNKYYTSSLISAPLIFEDKVLGVINVNNKKSRESYTEDDLKLLEGIANQASIAINNAQLYNNLQKSYLNVITAMANALDARDRYSYNHSKRVSEYVQRISKEMKLPPREVEGITTAALLHDIGKIGISDTVLLKTGKLTEEEWKIIKTHPRIGKEILKPLGFLDNILPIVEHEHERYDGKGYPDGLKGDEIPLGARIIAVADSYDAMTTDRVYRKALAKEDVLKELERCSGTQFDPKVVDAFLHTVPTFS